MINVQSTCLTDRQICRKLFASNAMYLSSYHPGFGRNQLSQQLRFADIFYPNYTIIIFHGLARAAKIKYQLEICGANFEPKQKTHKRKKVLLIQQNAGFSESNNPILRNPSFQFGSFSYLLLKLKIQRLHFKNLNVLQTCSSIPLNLIQFVPWG